MLFITWGLKQVIADSVSQAICVILELLDDHYRVTAYGVGRQGGDTVLQMTVSQIRPIVLGGHVAMPHPEGRAIVSVPVGQLLLMPLLAMAVVASWPVRSVAEWGLRCMLLVPFVIAAMVVDAPFVLWACLWDLHVNAFDPDRWSLLLNWQRFLQNGGRLLLGVGIGIATVALASRRIFLRRSFGGY